MKKIKRDHGINRFLKEALKIMRKHVARKSTNNWRKMHGKAMRRRYVKT